MTVERGVACAVAAGFLLEPTGRNPRHFTIHLDDVGRAIRRLCSLEHEIWRNPYHEGDTR